MLLVHVAERGQVGEKARVGILLMLLLLLLLLLLLICVEKRVGEER